MFTKHIIQKIKNKKNNSIIIYATVQTIIINEIHYPYAIGWTYNNNYYDLFVETEEEILNYNILKTFLLKLNPKKTKKYLIYFHNISNFDGFIFKNKLIQLNLKVELTENNNTIYNIKIENNLFIRDSHLILPIPLKDISHFFCTTHKKLEYNIPTIHINNLVENKKDIIKYLKKDILILEEGLKNFHQLIQNKFDYDIYNSLSLSSIAFNIFRHNFYDLKNYPIYKNTCEIDAFIRNTLFGEMTELYRPTFKNVYCYNANSHYPSMMRQDLPVGKGKWIKSFPIRDINIDEWWGFAKVIVYAPYMDRPVLPFKEKDDKIIYPYGRWISIYWNEEIVNAKHFGYKFDYLEGYEFQKGPVLKDFSQTLYEERKKYEKKHPMDLILKTLMNSLYGRFGLEIVKTNKIFIKKEEIDKYIDNYQILEWEPMGENIYVEYIKPSTLSQKNSLKNYNVNTAIHIAAAIKAKARIYRSRFIQDQNVFYTYKDSIYTEKKLEDHWIGNELGQMKLEPETKKDLSNIINNLDLNKREKVFNEKKEWVDTKPLYINSIMDQLKEEAKKQK